MDTLSYLSKITMKIHYINAINAEKQTLDFRIFTLPVGNPQQSSCFPKAGATYVYE